MIMVLMVFMIMYPSLINVDVDDFDDPPFQNSKK